MKHRARCVAEKIADVVVKYLPKGVTWRRLPLDKWSPDTQRRQAA